MLNSKLSRMNFITRQAVSIYVLRGIQTHINQLHDEQLVLFYLVFFIVPIFIFILINIKLRLNDLGLTSKWYPLAFVPIANLYLAFAPGKVGEEVKEEGVKPRASKTSFLKFSIKSIQNYLVVSYGLLISCLLLYAPYKLTFLGDKLPRVKSYYLFSFSIPERVFNTKVIKADLDYQLLSIEILVVTILFACLLYINSIYKTKSKTDIQKG